MTQRSVLLPVEIGAFDQVRVPLRGLAKHVELDDPARGLVVVIPVIGGVFLHPLTRDPIENLVVYAAGGFNVKILAPKILRCLGLFSIEGITQPAHFCANVVKALGKKLGLLGEARDQLGSLGINPGLDKDVLRLNGQTEIQGIKVSLSCWKPGELVITAIGQKALTEEFPRQERCLVLKGSTNVDLSALLALVDRLEREISRAEGDDVQTQPGVSKSRFGHGMSQVLELTDLVDDKENAAEEVEPLLEAELVEPSGEHTIPEAILPEATLPAAVVPDVGPDVTQDAAEQSFGAIELKTLLDKIGSEAKVSAFGGKIRIEAPLKVLQGVYTFYIEQSGPTYFKGSLVSPSGTRHPVSFDLKSIGDLKQVFDKVVMGS
jgi:hypothetical protein